MNIQGHWADAYRNAPLGTNEYWKYRFACFVQGITEEQAQARVDVLMRLEDKYRCIWHANWIYHGQQSVCHCAQCMKDRGGE